ncbi:hypothetical protein ACFU44_04085 [Nocardia rhizosphaerihabitans]|uniref:hypothetical protein n=1 Tax=Nocardia rhizosphaerihabitans TaxID=1691570 RepID=UPI003670B646
MLERIGAVANCARLGRHLRAFGAYTPMWKRLVRRWVFVVLVGAVVAFAFVKGETGIVMIVGGFVVLPLGLPAAGDHDQRVPYPDGAHVEYVEWTADIRSHVLN